MRRHEEIYDIIGVGIGPFNLGLAALSQPVDGLKILFFDKTDSFNWHPGLMLGGTTLQVPFMADLVTMADPTSAFSFLNYMKETGRIYKFYIRESFFLFRKEYNAYCKWVAGQLDCCHFGQEVMEVAYEEGCYKVTVKEVQNGQPTVYWARKLVLGTGTSPYVPPHALAHLGDSVIHTADFLSHREALSAKKSIAVVGSGQSAAEVFRELLPLAEKGTSLKWYTRSDRFFPLENHAKFTLEMTSPEYVDYFYGLSEKQRSALLKRQKVLYKGINYDLINEIYSSLYEMELSHEVDITLMPSCDLKKIEPTGEGGYLLEFFQTEQDKSFEEEAEAVILATGYHYREPTFLQALEGHIKRNTNGSLDVARNYTIDQKGVGLFVQNAELHTHGFVSPDLGMGAYRNAYILKELLGREVYKVEEQVAFQQFGLHRQLVETAV